MVAQDTRVEAPSLPNDAWAKHMTIFIARTKNCCRKSGLKQLFWPSSQQVAGKPAAQQPIIQQLSKHAGGRGEALRYGSPFQESKAWLNMNCSSRRI